MFSPICCYIWYGKLRSFGRFVDSIEFQFNDGTRGDRGDAFDIRYGHCRILPYTRIDVFVFRPVLAPFVLDLICILPLDLMHFARVDP